MNDPTQTNLPNWTEDQWCRVRKVVSDEAQKARVAAQFLPLFGPVDATVVALPSLRLGIAPVPPAPGAAATNRLQVDSSPTTFLTTISVAVALAGREVADPDLLAAMVAFRRAAVTIARVEDAVIFNGQPGRGLAPLPLYPGGWLNLLPRIYTVTGGASQAGLVPTGAAANPPGPVPASPHPNMDPRIPVPIRLPPGPAGLAQTQAWGEAIVGGVSQAIGGLEAAGHSGPFACYLSQNVFAAAHTPATSGMVLPRDRILPFLGGDYLRRTNTIPDGYGIVIALGGEPVEIVVARDITTRFLQVTAEPRYLFRVSERIALRVKEWNAVAVLHP